MKIPFPVLWNGMVAELYKLVGELLSYGQTNFKNLKTTEKHDFWNWGSSEIMHQILKRNLKLTTPEGKKKSSVWWMNPSNENLYLYKYIFLHFHHEWEGIGFMWKMTFEIFIKSLRFETPWLRKSGLKIYSHGTYKWYNSRSINDSRTIHCPLFFLVKLVVYVININFFFTLR